MSSRPAQVSLGDSGRWIHSPSLLAGGRGLADFHRAMMWMSPPGRRAGFPGAVPCGRRQGQLPPSAYGLRRPVGMALGRLRGGAGPVPAATVTRQLDDRGFSKYLAAIRRAEQLE